MTRLEIFGRFLGIVVAAGSIAAGCYLVLRGASFLEILTAGLCFALAAWGVKWFTDKPSA